MIQDITNLDDSAKKELKIVSVSRKRLIFKPLITELEFYKCHNDIIEISIDDGEDVLAINLDKDQIDALLAWINLTRQEQFDRFLR